jgi:arylsulfatase A
VADMIATLSDLVHQPLPPDAGEDSFDILPVLLNQTTQTPGRDFTVMLSAMGNYAVRSGPWKYIELRDDSKFPPEIVRHNFKTENAWQLYNLDHDLGEKLNLYLPTSPQVTTLQADLNQVRDNGRSRP